MDFLALINKYYEDNPPLKEILLRHSRQVADRCLKIAANHPELKLDVTFLEEAAMVHDIGIFLTDAESICCHGSAPYLCHGYLGAELMRREGYERHARVCERHTGTGLTRATIEERDLPLPHRDFLPETMEEKVICYADKYYSKTHLNKEKSYEKVLDSLQKYGEQGVITFREWKETFE